MAGATMDTPVKVSRVGEILLLVPNPLLGVPRYCLPVPCEFVAIVKTAKYLVSLLLFLVENLLFGILR
jgi:hypothetical protein